MFCRSCGSQNIGQLGLDQSEWCKAVQSDFPLGSKPNARCALCHRPIHEHRLMSISDYKREEDKLQREIQEAYFQGRISFIPG